MDLGLEILIGMIACTITIVGIVIALFLWTRGEANANRRDTVNMIRLAMEGIDKKIDAIHEEMKDFHNRLVENSNQLIKQDAEFRNRLLNIEERVRMKV